jgi:hypothetical protein
VPHAPSCATLSASGAGGSSAISSSSSSSLGSGSLMGYLWPVKKISYSATTVDGLRLHATRARCPAAAAPRPGLHPVMLVPGLASSSEATWDITPELSLLDHLARQGFDVWAVDLRGALPRGRGHGSSALIQLCAPSRKGPQLHAAPQTPSKAQYAYCGLMHSMQLGALPHTRHHAPSCAAPPAA